jgi:hypothetical protein
MMHACQVQDCMVEIDTNAEQERRKQMIDAPTSRFGWEQAYLRLRSYSDLAQ